MYHTGSRGFGHGLATHYFEKARDEHRLGRGEMDLGYFTPDLLLYSRGQERQDAIDKALPDTLDQMTIAVEAGMGFDGAMARVAENGKGVLAEELTRMVGPMKGVVRTAVGAFPQMTSAISTAVGRSWSGGTTRVTRPIRSAVSASTGSPLIIIHIESL
jgi:hypothetical protein